MDTVKETRPSFSDEPVQLSPESVASADHPAIARAINELLRDQDISSAFSNFVSHSSAVD